MSSNSTLQELRRHKLALSVIAVLVVIKFLLVPLMEWQEQKVSEIALLESKQNRMQQIFSNQQQLESYQLRLQQRLQEAQRYFLPLKDDSAFQLEQQKWLEARVNEHELKLSNIGWSPKLDMPELNAAVFRAQLSLEGRTLDVINFLQHLHSQSHYIEVRDMTINYSRQTARKLGRARVRLNLGFPAREGE